MSPEHATVIDSEIVEEVPQRAESESQAMTVSAPRADLTISRAPEVVLEEAHRAATALKGVIDAKSRKVVFNGKTYLENEDWSTIARFYGVAAKTLSVEQVQFGDGEDAVRGFKARAAAFRITTGEELSTSESLCLSDEPNWRSKPLFQIASMAQTRAQSKVLRQMFSWVVVLAGYAPTPADEMMAESAAPPPPVPRAVATPVAVAAAVPAPGFVAAIPKPEPKPKPVVSGEGRVVTKVMGTVKEGKRPWQTVGEDGTSYVTFDDTFGKQLQEAETAKRPLCISYVTEVRGNYTNKKIIGLTAADDVDEMFP